LLSAVVGRQWQQTLDLGRAQRVMVGLLALLVMGGKVVGILDFSVHGQ
jgi:hypothetical protein